MLKDNDETFWNVAEDSDEDFDTIINSCKTNREQENSKNESKMTTCEKLDFLWSEDEEEQDVFCYTTSDTIFNNKNEQFETTNEEKSNDDTADSNRTDINVARTEKNVETAKYEENNMILKDDKTMTSISEKINNNINSEQQNKEINTEDCSKSLYFDDLNDVVKQEYIFCKSKNTEEVSIDENAKTHNDNEKILLNNNADVVKQNTNEYNNEQTFDITNVLDTVLSKQTCSDAYTKSELQPQGNLEKIQSYYNTEINTTKKVEYGQKEMIVLNDEEQEVDVALDNEEQEVDVAPDHENITVCNMKVEEQKEMIALDNEEQEVDVALNDEEQKEMIVLDTYCSDKIVSKKEFVNKVENFDFLDVEDEDENAFYNAIKNSKTTESLKEKNVLVYNDNEALGVEVCKTKIELEDKNNANCNVDTLLLPHKNYDDKVKSNAVSFSIEQELKEEKCNNLGRDDNDKVCKKNYGSNQPFSVTTPKPIACVIGKNLITYYTTIAKRYTPENNEKEQKVNINNIYRFGTAFLLPKNDTYNLCDNEFYNYIDEILKLKNIHTDSICEVLGIKPVCYTGNVCNITLKPADVNTALNMSRYNNELAVEYCLNNNMWPLALLLSKSNEQVQKHVFSCLVDEDMTCLFDDQKMILQRHWKDYFMHFASTADTAKINKYIIHVFKQDKSHGYLVLICYHLCKIINLGDYLEYFSHNPQLLPLLLFIHKNHVKINQIDLLIVEYICDIESRDLEYAKSFYKLHKKEIRKDLQNKFDEAYNLNWTFGLKNVLNFGISKILDVDSENNNSKIEIEQKMYKEVNKTIKKVSVSNSTKILPNNLQTISNELPKQTKNVEMKNQYSSDSENSYNNVKSTVYGEMEHSKSFVDFFDTEKKDNVVNAEDDTLLFLNKYNLDSENDSVVKKQTKPVEKDEKSTFFSLFNVFKKKSYKIEVDGPDNIKYDPITKKWVSGKDVVQTKENSTLAHNKSDASTKNTQSEGQKMPEQQKTTENKLLEVSKKPNMRSSNEVSESSTLYSSGIKSKKMSLYAGKKSSMASFSISKKENR